MSEPSSDADPSHGSAPHFLPQWMQQHWSALTGAIALSVAVVFHEGSTIVVVLNALRLLGWREQATSR